MRFESVEYRSELNGKEVGVSRRPDIQGLRAIAVLLVVAFHAGLPVPGGFIGVDVFFVISGFVITAMLSREWANSGRIRFRQFYVRRFKRLTPALALMVTVVMLISFFLLSPFGPQQTVGQTGIGAMLLMANVVIARSSGGYFDASAETNPLLNTWSLSVEEQFYLVFPLILVIGWFLTRRSGIFKFSPYFLVGSVALISLSVAVLGSVGHVPERLSVFFGFYSPFTRFWEFALGGLLALSTTRLTIRSPQLALAVGIAGSVMLASSLWLITDRTPFPGVWTLLPVTATLLIILAGSKSSNLVSRAISTRPLVKVGDWSYSIYLWHWPFIVFATVIWPGNFLAVLSATTLSFIPALASYYWVEQPLRTFVPKSSLRFTGFVTATVLSPVVIAGALVLGANAQWWLTWPTESSSSQNDHVAMSRGCTDQPFDPVLCQWGDERSEGTVFLVGDSQAYSYADGVIEAATLLGMRTVVSSRSGCPFSTLAATDANSYSCPAIQAEWLEFALRARPEVVVIANRSSGYTRPDSGWRNMLDEKGRPALTPVAAIGAYERGLEGVVSQLTKIGIGVVILQNIPEPARIANNFSMLNKLFPRKELMTFDSSITLENREGAARVEVDVAKANPGVVVFDPFLHLCPETEGISKGCPLTRNGESLYLDSWHLTRAGSLELTSALAEAIQTAADERP